MTAKTVRLWYRIHKWTSLVCTAFLLMSCLTGLPLIFLDELEPLLEHRVPATAVPAGTPDANLDAMVAVAKARLPALRPLSISWDDDEPKISVNMSPTLAPKLGDIRSLVFDEHTGKMLEERPLGKGLGAKVFELHREIFLGLPGELLMGLMAVLFVTALVSGALVYGPFMRQLDFGTVRRSAQPRMRWFDLHNLVGIVTLSWGLVVGATGVMNALSTPLFGVWRAQTLPALIAPYYGRPMPQRLASIDASVARATKALPGMKIVSVVFPNDVLTSPRHYLVWMKGDAPVTSRLLTPAIIDAETGKLTVAKGLPWYLRALEVSRPLHFGDYGGMPLKIIWALFDIALIVVLISGLYLWLSRRKRPVESELNRLVHIEEISTGTSEARMPAR